MPSSNTSDFSVTSVGLLLEMSHTPSLHDTGKSFTLGHTNDVNDLILSKDVIDSDFLLEETVSEVDLIGDSLSSVDLDLEDVVLFLSDVLDEVVLGVHDGSNNCAVFFNSVQLDFNFLGILGSFCLIAAEGFLFGVNPVLVEPSEGSLIKMVGPDGSEGSESSWGLNVSNQTNNF